MIDSAGTIYLIGGVSDNGDLNDIWSSADKGANCTQGGTTEGTLLQRVLTRYSDDTHGFSRDTWEAFKEHSRSTTRVLKGTQGVPRVLKGLRPQA